LIPAARKEQDRENFHRPDFIRLISAMYCTWDRNARLSPGAALMNPEKKMAK
jgi:hypothetical protein